MLELGFSSTLFDSALLLDSIHLLA